MSVLPKVRIPTIGCGRPATAGTIGTLDLAAMVCGDQKFYGCYHRIPVSQAAPIFLVNVAHRELVRELVTAFEDQAGTVLDHGVARRIEPVRMAAEIVRPGQRPQRGGLADLEAPALD